MLPGLLKAAMASGLAVACGAGFVEQTFHSTTVPCNHSLTTPVPVTCEGKVFDKAKFEVWSVNLDFSFGRLSQEQWTCLRDQYTKPWAGGAIIEGRTALFDRFDTARSYRLLDFLPIQVRGLDGFCFIEEDEPLPTGLPMPDPATAPRLYGKTILVPNCWGTVYEVLRSMSWTLQQKQDVFHDVYSTDDKVAQAWLREATVPVPGPYTAAKRQFGDVMFIWLQDKAMQRPILEHAVVFIDQDIVFEKAGTGDLNPFRLTDLATVQKEWKPDELGGLFRWELRRPQVKAPAKTFAGQFSVSSQGQDARWPQFWSWPQELQEELTLAVADNPRNQSAPPDELTLLKSRRVTFCKGQRWSPCSKEASILV